MKAAVISSCKQSRHRPAASVTRTPWLLFTEVASQLGWAWGRLSPLPAQNPILKEHREKWFPTASYHLNTSLSRLVCNSQPFWPVCAATPPWHFLMYLVGYQKLYIPGTTAPMPALPWMATQCWGKKNIASILYSAPIISRSTQHYHSPTQNRHKMVST